MIYAEPASIEEKLLGIVEKKPRTPKLTQFYPDR